VSPSASLKQKMLAVVNTLSAQGCGPFEAWALEQGRPDRLQRFSNPRLRRCLAKAYGGEEVVSALLTAGLSALCIKDLGRVVGATRAQALIKIPAPANSSGGHKTVGWILSFILLALLVVGAVLAVRIIWLPPSAATPATTPTSTPPPGAVPTKLANFGRVKYASGEILVDLMDCERGLTANRDSNVRHDSALSGDVQAGLGEPSSDTEAAGQFADAAAAVDASACRSGLKSTQALLNDPRISGTTITIIAAPCLDALAAYSGQMTTDAVAQHDASAASLRATGPGAYAHAKALSNACFESFRRVGVTVVSTAGDAPTFTLSKLGVIDKYLVDYAQDAATAPPAPSAPDVSDDELETLRTKAILGDTGAIGRLQTLYATVPRLRQERECEAKVDAMRATCISETCRYEAQQADAACARAADHP
jgi:hypothetical protein